MIDYFIIGFIFVPIVFGLFQYILKMLNLKVIGLLMQSGLLLCSLYILFTVEMDAGLKISLINVPTPVGMALRVDSLSLIMIILNNFIFLIMCYASHHRTYYNRLFIFLICTLQGLINGIFLSSDFFNIYLLIELATIIVSVLVMYKKDGRSLYDGMMYLIVNMVGMAFFLFGIGYIYKIFGVLDFEMVSAMIADVPKTSLILPFAFLMTGASLKSAFMPLFSWLPKAHGTASAPTIISAILSGIFVKTGIYLFIRIADLFAPVINLSHLFFIVAVFTAVIGAIFAMAHTDIKLIMSYSTISQVGIIMLGLNNVSQTGYTGGVFYLVNHAVFKVLMFYCVGLIIKIYKTRDIREMNSLWKTSKTVSLGMIIGLFSLTGFPLLGSGIGKYMIGEYYQVDFIKPLFLMLNMTSILYCLPLYRIILPKTDRRAFKIKTNQRMTIYILVSSLIGLGLAYGPIMSSVFSYDIVIKTSRMLEKLLEYGLVFIGAFCVSMIIRHFKKIKSWVKSFDFSFNTINMAIVSYFLILIIVSRIV